MSDPRWGDSTYVAVDAALWQCASTTTERVDPYVRGQEAESAHVSQHVDSLPWFAERTAVEVDDG